MNRKNIVIIILCCAIGLILYAIFGIFNNNSSNKDNNIVEKYEDFVDTLDDGIKVNNNEKVNEKKEFDGLEINNINFTYNTDGASFLEFEVYNNTANKYNSKMILVSVLDKDNEVMQTLVGLIPDINSGESEKISITIDKNIINAFDLTIEDMPSEDD